MYTPSQFAETRLEVLHDLTHQQEGAFAQPWTVDDAPRDYTDKLLAGLVKQYNNL